MEIRSLLRTMRDKWWLIVPSFLMVFGATLVWTVSQRPVYEADLRLFVEPSGVSEDVLDQYALLSRQSELSETYAQIAVSPPIRRAAIEELELDARQQDDVRVESRLVAGTTLLELSARSTDPDLARDYANATASALVAFVDDLDTPFTLAPVYEAGTPSRPVSPNVPVNVALGAALGLALAIGIGLIAELLRVRHPATAMVQMLDEESGAYSEPFFRARLRQEVSRSRRAKSKLALAVVNVNHRGALDGLTPGTRSGALRQLAGLMEAHLRPEDVAARLDDDLFGLFFPDTSESDAAGMVEAIRTRLALPALGTRSDGAPLRVQPAAGVVAHSGDAVTEDELLTRVLRALKGAESIPVGTTQAWSMLSAQPGT